MVAPPMGARVSMIPPEYRPVIINGVTYYTNGGTYYIYTSYGYQVVPAPVASRTVFVTQPTFIAQPAYVPQPAQVVTVSPNKTKVAEGIGLGAILGALTGGIVGHQMKGNHDARGALIGGVTGAAMGGIFGAQIPNQEQ